MIRSRPAAPQFLPAAFLLAIWVAWIPAEGGYFPDEWYPAALVAVALLAATVIAGARRLPESRSGRAALALLGGLTAWSFLSILWGVSPGSAWEGSNQLLLYLAMAWTVALAPWRTGSAAVYFGVWSLAVTVACAGELVSALAASDLAHYVLESRWQQPTGYANASAGLAVMAMWPALALSVRRATPIWLQAAFLSAAAFLANFSLLAQSRASMIVVLAVTPLFVAMAPERVRLAARLAVLGVAVAVAARPVYDVWSTAEADGALEPALDHAATWIAVAVAVAAVGALGIALVERRVTPGERVVRGVRIGSRAALAGVLVLALGAGLVKSGEIRAEASERWDTFKATEVTDTGPRLTRQTSDKRYDYWRVSLNTFGDAPVAGVGTGGFEREYTEHRRHAKPSRAAHSVWMRALAEWGAVGLALLVGFVAAVAAGLVRARRRLEAGDRWLVAAAAGVLAYFLGQATFDWLELIPALAAPALALPFVALALGRDEQPGTPRSPRNRRLGTAAAAVVAAAALGALALPYLATRHVDAALSSPPGERADAERYLDRAASLNPLAAEPHLTRGRLALRRADFVAAERAFRRALEVEDAWYPHFQLALLASRAGREDAAKREIALARRLNPPDQLVQRAAELIGDGKRLDPNGVDRRKVEIRLYNDPRGH